LERALVNSAAVFRSPRERVNYPYLTAVCKRDASHLPGLGRVPASARERGGRRKGTSPRASMRSSARFSASTSWSRTTPSSSPERPVASDGEWHTSWAAMASITAIDCEGRRAEPLRARAACRNARPRVEPQGTSRVSPDGDEPSSSRSARSPRARLIGLGSGNGCRSCRGMMLRRTMTRWSDRDGRTFRQELRGYADAIAAEGAATTASLAREASLSTY
jgi:hypothetical protein